MYRIAHLYKVDVDGYQFHDDYVNSVLTHFMCSIISSIIASSEL